MRRYQPPSASAYQSIYANRPLPLPRRNVGDEPTGANITFANQRSNKQPFNRRNRQRNKKSTNELTNDQAWTIENTWDNTCDIMRQLEDNSKLLESIDNTTQVDTNTFVQMNTKISKSMKHLLHAVNLLTSQMSLLVRQIQQIETRMNEMQRGNQLPESLSQNSSEGNMLHGQMADYSANGTEL